MNKILQSGSSGDINVTNDGATILKSIQLDNAPAKISLISRSLRRYTLDPLLYPPPRAYSTPRAY
ncbi:uncharacterized protein HD556DRAFT_1418505 [Suillus plorans]|uniref:Uncharacterized protein n=1 Tax=Suillus plorans TaxID=116603 RepID=A0A9P7ABD9_9AGAM|nr:uncharacterized protein HD556DRAFT_1418505 [Suillus plorans]KAG1785887.1 hypothetical protein HD556DRAFT_1418505 [Suillus plorans]